MLSQATGYAATALGYVASSGGKPALVKDIAQATNIPPSYLAKIIQSLSKREIITTQRGIGGGVLLNRPPDQITLFDICVALGDAAIEHRCMLGALQCSDEQACPAHKFWASNRTECIEFLQKTTVSDIATFEARHRHSLTINSRPVSMD